MKHLNIDDKHKAVLSVMLSAILFALCVPISKLLLPKTSSTVMGGLLYFGAGLGLCLTNIIKKQNIELKLTSKELPYIIAMILLDISAIILLMLGISKTTGANVSLLGNFELVATSIVACLFFKEFLSKQLWIAVFLITVACSILTFEGKGCFIFNIGSLLVLLSAFCWGIENNCTRMLSVKDTRQITMIKGLFSGMGSIVIALIIGAPFPEIKYFIGILVLGFISYGISVCLYIYAQRFLGAAKTASYYATSPFWSVLFCLLLLGEKPSIQFYIALVIMLIGTMLVFHSTQKS